MRTSRIALIVVALALAAGLVACGPSLPKDPPGITGRVTEEMTADEGMSAILVEATGSAEGQVADKAVVRITEQTVFFDASGKKIDQPTLQGATISVWFSGPVAESYPVQGTAGTISLR